MSSDAVPIYVLGLAPIPVDHRVEIHWYRETVSTAIGGSAIREEPQQPWIKDLDDGVVYAGHWLFQQGGVFGDRVNVGTREIREGLTRSRSVVGRVISTQVVTVNTSVMTIETLLLVAPDQTAHAYR